CIPNISKNYEFIKEIECKYKNDSALPNFRRISHSGTFPPRRPNQSGQISHSGRFRRNGRINPAKFRTRGRF
ncbi:MAG: hypothetical protein Q8881_03680, partial [Sweet potato little leaf phytoplasma]|nr:hypothetical protein [Sweet potato little leaf phytoplasma]